MPSLHLQLLTSIVSEYRARNNNHYWEGNTPTRSPDLCISQVTRCRRRSRACLHCQVRSPTSSLPADSPAGESLTNHRRMLQDTKCVYRKIRRADVLVQTQTCVCVWTDERSLTQTVDFSRDGRHELGEKEVCEGPVHEGHLQLLRLQGQTSFHLRLRERDLNTHGCNHQNAADKMGLK